MIRRKQSGSAKMNCFYFHKNKIHIYIHIYGKCVSVKLINEAIVGAHKFDVKKKVVEIGMRECSIEIIVTLTALLSSAGEK